MMSNMFSVFDLKAKAFMQPFFSAVRATAVRSFVAAVNDPSTMMHKHPEDFILFHLATFDDETAKILPLAQPEQLCNAVSVKEASHAKDA